MMFKRDVSLDLQFDSIPDLIWYPYVGKDYQKHEIKSLVFAHNIPVRHDVYAAKKTEWASKSTWADAIEEYAYEQRDYTKAFRSFVKGCLALDGNYGYSSPDPIKESVGDFLCGISYVNYIQGLVASDRQNATAEPEQVEVSKKIALGLLCVLKPTHCIVWGKNVYNYILNTSGVERISEEINLHKGFARTKIRIEDGHEVRLMKVFHPGMPGFSPYSKRTSEALRDFITGKN